MWGALLSWASVAIVVSLLVSGGLGVMSMTPPAYTVAQMSFSIAALILSARLGWWIAFGQPSDASPAHRLFFAFIILGGIGMLWVLSLTWVDSRRRFASGQQLTEPVIHVEPEVGVKKPAEGKNGVFTVSLENSGLADINDVQVFNDYFVAQKRPQIVITRIGGYSTLPDQTIKYLRSKETADITVDFSKVIGLMWSYAKRYNLPNVLGVRMMITYRRAVDGKPFSFVRCYGVAGENGELLYTPDPRGIDMPPEIAKMVLTLSEVEPYLRSTERWTQPIVEIR
jgi:hypothetical protein